MDYKSLNMTKSFEGVRFVAYRDSGGVLTIGYGHTGPDVHEGMVCTQVQADAWLLHDMQWAVQTVQHWTYGHVIYQGVFDAMTDFTFNCGSGSFRNSGMYLAAIGGEWQLLCDTLAKYIHDAHGTCLKGLVRRRREEIALVEASTGFKWQEPVGWNS